jgi:hypothetical protein
MIIDHLSRSLAGTEFGADKMFSRFEQLFLWEYLPYKFLSCEVKFAGIPGVIVTPNWIRFGMELEKRQRERDVAIHGFVEPIYDGLDIEIELAELSRQCKVVQARHDTEPCSKELMNMALSVFWRTIRLDNYPDMNPNDYINVLCDALACVELCKYHTKDPLMVHLLQKPHSYMNLHMYRLWRNSLFPKRPHGHEE